MNITKDNTFYQIVCIGAGANGSHFFRNLLQDIATYRDSKRNQWTRTHFPANVIIADGDRVETKNLSNQLFDHEDVDMFKVDALTERYGVHYDVDVFAISDYVTSLEHLQSLFNMNRPTNRHVLPVLVGLVDNNRTRMLLHEFFHLESIPELVYIDAGVEGVLLKEQLLRDPNAEEKIKGSGFSGQIVCGYKKDGQVYIPPVADVYASILADEESVFPNQSCGDLILQNPQRSATNKMAAQLTNTFINNLFHSGEIVQEELIFNARYGSSQARFVSKRTENFFNDNEKQKAFNERQNFFKERELNDTTLSTVS